MTKKNLNNPSLDFFYPRKTDSGKELNLGKRGYQTDCFQDIRYALDVKVLIIISILLESGEGS